MAKSLCCCYSFVCCECELECFDHGFFIHGPVNLFSVGLGVAYNILDIIRHFSSTIQYWTTRQNKNKL